MVAQRSYKSSLEIERIEKSLETAYEMHTTAMRMTRPGVYEREVAAAIEQVAIAMGGRVSYPVIFSVDGQILHNHDHSNMMKAGDIVVNDSGAECAMHYASDITRTIPVGGKFTERQREVYDIVLDAQLKAIDAIRPGVEFRGVHLSACEVMAEGLKSLGLMKGDMKEAVSEGAHALFFQCGFGHMMGLDVHDMEDLGEDYVGYDGSVKRSGQFGLVSLRLGKKLEKGFVVTAEPGIYFIGQLIDKWRAEKRHEQFINYEAVQSYRDFGGVRIEDNILVTADGCRLLGKPIPKSIEEVETLLSL